MNAVEVRDLCFQYEGGKDVLKDVDFTLPEGSYTAILGPNGSGKSTLAKLLVGLLEKKSGSIKIFGEELTEESVYRIRDSIGIVFQNPDNQFIGATVRDDIAFGLENHCVPRGQMDPIIEKYAAKVSMTEYLEKEPTKLSGGQKQRVAIAGVLAMSPKIMIFDESTSMLDPQGKNEINALIEELHAERSMTIISITHDIDEAAKCDEIIVLDNGVVAMSGTPMEVLSNEKELSKHSLDMPFSLQLGKELAKRHVKVKPALTVEEMAEELWQLCSAK